MHPIRTMALACAALCSSVAMAAPAHTAIAVDPAMTYVQPDGSVQIVGNDGLEDVIGQLDALFVRRHPGIRFTTVMKGSSTGMPALTAGVTAFAPLTRDMWPGDRAAFRQTYGYDATAIKIGYNGYGPRAPHKTAPAVYVHRSNPLAGMSLEQLAQVLTTGALPADINTWSQLGLTGTWAPRRIHAYGLRDDGGFATGIRLARLGGHPFAVKYEALASREAVIKAVAQDPYGIALLGWVDAAKTSDQVRIVPLGRRTGDPYYLPSYEDVRGGRYPLSMPVQLYVNRPPGQPLDPLVKAYLRIALSPEGQAILAAQKDTEEGYVPLSSADVARERAALEAM